MAEPLEKKVVASYEKSCPYSGGRYLTKESMVIVLVYENGAVECTKHRKDISDCPDLEDACEYWQPKE